MRPFVRCLTTATVLLAAVTLGGCGIPPTDLGTDRVIAGDLADDGTAVVCQRTSDGGRRGTVIGADGASRPLVGPRSAEACPVAVNAAGEAVGQADGEAVLWDVRTGSVRSLPVPAGYPGAEVLGLNENGLAVGRVVFTAPGYPGGSSGGVLWDVRTGSVSSLQQWAPSGVAAALVNNAGLIVGRGDDQTVWSVDPAAGTATRTFSIAGPNTYNTGAVTGVNERGEIVGWAPVAPPVTVVSYRWDPATASATPVQPDGVRAFKAEAIDGDGRILGTGQLASGQPHRALRYDGRDGSVVPLDDDATLASEPLAVNAHGHVLGITRTSAGLQVLKVWM